MFQLSSASTLGFGLLGFVLELKFIYSSYSGLGSRV